MRNRDLDRADRDQIFRTGKDLHGIPIDRGHTSALMRGKARCRVCGKVKDKDDMLGAACEDCTNAKD